MCLLRNLLNLLALSCSNTLYYSFNICRICSDFSFILIICLFLPAMATHSSTLAWKIPWAEEPGSLQSVGSRRVGHFHFSLSCIGEGNRNPLQCSCLENPRDGGARWAAVYGVAQSRTRLKRLSSSSSSNHSDSS